MPEEATRPEGSAHGTPAAAPTTSPAIAQPTKPDVSPATFSLPKELEGKSPAEIGAYYSDRYKDYDALKTRAADFDAYEKTGFKPDQISQTANWVRDLLANLQAGKRAYLDAQNNRIVFLDAQGQAAAPAATPGVTAAADRFEDWETLMPVQQAERIAEHTWNARLKPEVEKTIQRYDQMFADALKNLQARETIFLDVIDRWIANPKLNPRDLMAKAIELGRSAAGNPIDLAVQQLSSPAEIERLADERAAAKFAEMKQKWEQEHAAPILEAPAAFTPRALSSDGKPLTRGAIRQRIVQQFRQNGILKGPPN